MRRPELYSEKEILARLRERSPRHRYILVKIGPRYELHLRWKGRTEHAVPASAATIRKLQIDGKVRIAEEK